MPSVPAEVRLSFEVSPRFGAGSVWKLRERKGSYQAPRRDAGSSSVSMAPARRVPAAVSAPVGLHLKPGQKGTKHLVAEYGDRLVCVRYRYDTARKKRIKTVELVVAERDWEPRFAPDEIVALRVAYNEVATRRRVKQAGGTWNSNRMVWQLRYDRVVAFGLRRRIVTLQYPGLDAAASSTKHPDADAGPSIHTKMPASSSGCPASTGRCDDEDDRAVD